MLIPAWVPWLALLGSALAAAISIGLLIGYSTLARLSGGRRQTASLTDILNGYETMQQAEAYDLSILAWRSSIFFGVFAALLGAVAVWLKGAP